MNDSTKEAGMPKGKPELIRIDEGEIRNHLDQIVRVSRDTQIPALRGHPFSRRCTQSIVTEQK